MVLDVATDMLAPAALSYESPQAVIRPHMTEHMIVVLLALLCTAILLAGLAIIVPWNYIWRPCHDYMATRRANTGMKAKSIEGIPCIIYGKSMSRVATDCAICLAEFVEGEVLRVLPICNHGFHMECVDKWLRSHSLCPTCRHYVLDPGCKMVASHIMPSQSDAWGVQIHSARACEESREIIDLEFGVK